MLVVADQCDFLANEMPRAGPTTEGIDRLPAQLPPPSPDGVSGRTAMPPTHQGEAEILHLVKVEQAFDPDDHIEDTCQETALQDTGRVGEGILGRGQPGQRLWQEEEGPGVLCACGEKGGAGDGIGRPAGSSGMFWGGRSITPLAEESQDCTAVEGEASFESCR